MFGMSIRNPLESVLTFAEATKRWGLGHSTLREAAKYSRFLPGEIRKSGGTWLVTEKAMRRLYGDPKGGKEHEKVSCECLQYSDVVRTCYSEIR